MMTDPIADMLTRVRNATARRSLTTKVPASRIKEAIAKILLDNGWLEKFELIKPEDTPAHLLLTLKYHHNAQPVMRGIQRISKPGQRIYLRQAKLTRQMSSQLETLVISTSKGLMTSYQAKAAGLGGEILFKIW